MANDLPKTPMLDELEKGPWPSFVKEIKLAAKKNPMAGGLLENGFAVLKVKVRGRRDLAAGRGGEPEPHRGGGDASRRAVWEDDGRPGPAPGRSRTEDRAQGLAGRTPLRGDQSSRGPSISSGPTEAGLRAASPGAFLATATVPPASAALNAP